MYRYYDDGVSCDMMCLVLSVKGHIKFTNFLNKIKTKENYIKKVVLTNDVNQSKKDFLNFLATPDKEVLHDQCKLFWGNVNESKKSCGHESFEHGQKILEYFIQNKLKKRDYLALFCGIKKGICFNIGKFEDNVFNMDASTMLHFAEKKEESDKRDRELADRLFSQAQNQSKKPLRNRSKKPS